MERKKITREHLKLKVQGGSVKDGLAKAYILWEKKGKKVQSRLVPVLYERAIECAASERWAVSLAEDENGYIDFWEDYLGFQVGEVR